MQLIALAVSCFLLFCVGHHHHPKHRHVHSTPVVTDCATIQTAYQNFVADKVDQGQDVGRDEFVKTYPPAKQRHVLECIGDQ